MTRALRFLLTSFLLPAGACGAAAASAPGPTPARQGLPLSFDLAPEQVERALQAAGWTVEPILRAHGTFLGEPARTGYYASVRATRGAWFAGGEIVGDTLVSFEWVSPALPSKEAVEAMLGEIVARVGEPSWTQPLGPGLPVAAWECPGRIEVRLDGQPGAWKVSEQWSRPPPPPRAPPPPPAGSAAPRADCPHSGPPCQGSPCRYPLASDACTYPSLRSPEHRVACSCRPEGTWSCTTL
jgi:hypothetical protein